MRVYTLFTLVGCGVALQPSPKSLRRQPTTEVAGSITSRKAAAVGLDSLRRPPSTDRVPAKQVSHDYSLPVLTPFEQDRLATQGRVERRSRRNRVGEAFVVVDTKLPADLVWSALLDINTWSSRMRGVRSSLVREERNEAIRAAFKVTKLRLPANLVFTPLAEDPVPTDPTVAAPRTLAFTLDDECTNLAVENLVGFWHVEDLPDGRGTRVYLKASIGACALVPMSALDYVADKALARATEWLRMAPSSLVPRR